MTQLSDSSTVSREHRTPNTNTQALIVSRSSREHGHLNGSVQYISYASSAQSSLPHVTGIVKILPFLGLIITTALSLFLQIADVNQYALSGSVYNIVLSSRASIQIGIQIFATFLGFIHVTAVTILINYAIRIRMTSSSIPLNGLRFWSGLSTPIMSWTLPFKLGAPLLFFVLLCLVPSALWAGAITPVETQILRNADIAIPSYRNPRDLLNIREWPSEVTSGAPTAWTTKGLFSYAVGMKMQGSLLASAASGTTVDGGVRRHAKFDASTFEYIGRSYGVAASPGLVDDSIVAAQILTVGYSYQEPGYASSVRCIYNETSEFGLHWVPGYNNGEFVNLTSMGMLWHAGGLLPDSAPEIPEISEYIGRDPGDAIVAIGVASSSPQSPKYLAFATGADYTDLNQMQCQVDFVPTMFNVTVSVSNKTITAVPAGSAANIEPLGNLTRAAMRQYELIANDQTNIYASLVGDSFNSSINNLRTSLEYRGILDSMTDDEIALKAIENSLTAMMDDMLVAYGSAQLMIGNHTVDVPATVQVQAIQFGEEIYIILVFVLNAIVVLMVIIEAARTKWWRKLVTWDYLNPAELLLAGWRGGRRKYAENKILADQGRAWAFEPSHGVQASRELEGKIRITMSGDVHVALHLSKAGVETRNWKGKNSSSGQVA